MSIVTKSKHSILLLLAGFVLIVSLIISHHTCSCLLKFSLKRKVECSVTDLVRNCKELVWIVMNSIFISFLNDILKQTTDHRWNNCVISGPSVDWQKNTTGRNKREFCEGITAGKFYLPLHGWRVFPEQTQHHEQQLMRSLSTELDHQHGQGQDTEIL